MIRFRYSEDERRYLLLLGRLQRIIASFVPETHLHEGLRVLGKLQDLLLLEGIRQGVAITAIASSVEGGPTNLKPFQLHAHIYGSTDTPLHPVETEWMERLFTDPGHRAATEERLSGWLEKAPMRFTPGLNENDWEELTGPPARAPLPAAVAHVPEFQAQTEVIASPFGEQDERPADGPWTVQSEPAMLDRIRDFLVAMPEPKPASWEDLVLSIHLSLNLDAGYIDLALGTGEGRTMLSQCGLHLSPGPLGLDLVALAEEIERSQTEDDEPSGSAPPPTP